MPFELKLNQLEQGPEPTPIPEPEAGTAVIPSCPKSRLLEEPPNAYAVLKGYIYYFENNSLVRSRFQTDYDRKILRRPSVLDPEAHLAGARPNWEVRLGAYVTHGLYGHSLVPLGGQHLLLFYNDEEPLTTQIVYGPGTAQAKPRNLNRCLIIDVARQKATEVDATCIAPRRFQAAQCIKDRVYLTGGCYTVRTASAIPAKFYDNHDSVDVTYDDVYVFDLESMAWHEFPLDAAATVAGTVGPLALAQGRNRHPLLRRSHHTAAAIQGRYLLLGPSGGEDADFAILDTEAHSIQPCLLTSLSVGSIRLTPLNDQEQATQLMHDTQEWAVIPGKKHVYVTREFGLGLRREKDVFKLLLHDGSKLLQA